MDRHCALLMALGLTAGLIGCVHQQALVPESSDPLPQASAKPDPELRQRAPKASTCLTLGHLQEQLAANPKSTPAERDQHRDVARKCYQQAIRMEPKAMPAYRALANLYTAQGDHAQAVATYEQVVQIDPKDATLRLELGMCQSRLKEWDPALKNLRKAVELDPENRLYVHTLGFALARSGQFEESYSLFEKACGKAQAHYNLARMHRHLRQNEQSRQHLQLALQADPGLDRAKQLLTELEHPALPPNQGPTTGNAATP